MQIHSRNQPKGVIFFKKKKTAITIQPTRQHNSHNQPAENSIITQLRLTFGVLTNPDTQDWKDQQSTTTTQK